MRRVTTALAGLVLGLALASCQLLTPFTQLDAASPEPTATTAPASKEPLPLPAPSQPEMPVGSPVPQLSPSIEIPPPTD